MKFTSQGYFNAVISVSDPETIHEFFEVTEPGEFHNRLEDVETALQFINEMLNSDAMMNCLNSEEVLKVDVADLMMKGLVLERMRFRILRDEWEPMFNPLPTDPSEHYDPDIFPEHKWFAVHLKNDEGENVERSMIQVHEKDGESGKEYWVQWRDIRLESPDLVELLDEFHNQVSHNHENYIAEQVGKKSMRLLSQLRLDNDEDIDLEKLEE